MGPEPVSSPGISLSRHTCHPVIHCRSIKSKHTAYGFELNVGKWENTNPSATGWPRALREEGNIHGAQARHVPSMCPKAHRNNSQAFIAEVVLPDLHQFRLHTPSCPLWAPAAPYRPRPLCLHHPAALLHNPQPPDFPVTHQRPAETCISQEGFPGTLAIVTCTSVTGVFIFLISCSLDVWGYGQGSLEPPNLHKSLQHRYVPLDGMCKAGRQHQWGRPVLFTPSCGQHLKRHDSNSCLGKITPHDNQRHTRQLWACYGLIYETIKPSTLTRLEFLEKRKVELVNIFTSVPLRIPHIQF